MKKLRLTLPSISMLEIFSSWTYLGKMVAILHMDFSLIVGLGG